MVAVADDERQRRAERSRVAKPAEHLDLVRLELLARAAAVPLLASAQIGVDRLLVEAKARGKPGDDRNERRAVRFAGGDECECHAPILRAAGTRPRRHDPDPLNVTRHPG